jgi:hypothetical protein
MKTSFALLSAVLAMAAAGDKPGQAPAPSGSFVMEVPGREGPGHRVRWRFRDLKSSRRGGTYLLAATVETESKATVQVGATIDPRGAQTLHLRDGRGHLHQLALSAQAFRLQYPIEGADRARAIQVGASANLIEMLGAVAGAPNARPSSSNYASFPLHRLLVEVVGKASPPDLAVAGALRERGLDLLAAAFPVDTVMGAADEWTEMNGLLEVRAGALALPPMVAEIPGALIADPRLPRLGGQQAPPEKEPREKEPSPPACTSDDTGSDRNGHIDVTIPSIARVEFDGVSAYVHAKCVNAQDDCVKSAGGGGNINAARVLGGLPECNRFFPQGQVLFAGTAKGEGEARVERGLCRVDRDDRAVVAGLTVTIQGVNPARVEASLAEDDSICAAAKARLDAKLCVGRDAAGTLAPAVVSDIVGRTNTSCAAIVLPPAK